MHHELSAQSNWLTKPKDYAGGGPWFPHQ